MNSFCCKQFAVYFKLLNSYGMTLVIYNVYEVGIRINFCVPVNDGENLLEAKMSNSHFAML